MYHQDDRCRLPGIRRTGRAVRLSLARTLLRGTHMADRRDIRFVKSFDDVNIATAVCGSGPPLIKAATWLTHIEQTPPGTIHSALIEEFGRTHTYIEYDTRGCGLSQRKVDDISFDAWVRDLEAVADASGHARFALLGFTCAAGVAVEYAARHPDRVSHLILFGGFVVSQHQPPRPCGPPRGRSDAGACRSGLGLQLACISAGVRLEVPA